MPVEKPTSIDSLLNDEITLGPSDIAFHEAPKLSASAAPRHHLSYSELTRWVSCPYSHKLKYIDGVKTEKDGPSEHTEFGHVIHTALEVYLETRVMPAIEDVKVGLTYTFNDLLPNAAKLRPSDWQDCVEPILSEVPAFMTENFGDWKYVAAEEALMEPIDGHEQLFKGFIDGVIETVGKRGEKIIQIIDWKSTSFFWNRAKRSDPQKLMQLVLYKYFYSRKHNIPLENIRCGFVLLRRSKKSGNCELIPVSVGPVTIKRAVDTVDKMLGYVRKRMYPKNFGSACTYCPYNKTALCTR